MKVEKLDRVAVAVKNLDDVQKLFAELFETTFERSPVETISKITKDYGERGSKERETRYAKVFISPIGLELVEMDPPCEREGVLSFHLKVSNLEQAKAEMEREGIRLLTEIKHGGLKEAIFNPDDLHGVRLVLVEYETPTVMGAILKK
jgi:hypothetical protein